MSAGRERIELSLYQASNDSGGTGEDPITFSEYLRATESSLLYKKFLSIADQFVVEGPKQHGDLGDGLNEEQLLELAGKDPFEDLSSESFERLSKEEKDKAIQRAVAIAGAKAILASNELAFTLAYDDLERMQREVLQSKKAPESGGMRRRSEYVHGQAPSYSVAQYLDDLFRKKDGEEETSYSTSQEKGGGGGGGLIAILALAGAGLLAYKIMRK